MNENAVYQQVLPAHLVTEKGNVKAPVDLFIRWMPGAGRMYPEFTERGDRFEKEDAGKMLIYLVKYFIKTYQQWDLAFLRDNRIPPSDKEHVILKYLRKDDQLLIETNRLNDFPFLAQKIPMPEWLTTPSENK